MTTVIRPDGRAAGVVLCVNTGSSSLKLALFEVGGRADATLWRELWRGSGHFDPTSAPDLTPARDELRREGRGDPAIVAHRVVHGGATHIAAEVVDDALVADLRSLTSFAPLHQPACLAGIAAGRRTFPDSVHVASFDTAFHHTMPEVATHLGLPHAVWRQGIRRYGFHGLSYRHTVDTLGPEALGRAVIAHLGSGASLCAVADGRSVDTTMGLTPAGGLVMATRAGDLDPGVAIHLLRHGTDGRPLGADGLEDLVNHCSGLLGLSGEAPDMQTLLAARRTDARADLAVRIFCRHVTKGIASMAATLGGIDTLVFTGGIGEHAAAIRSEVCGPLSFLGIDLDEGANADVGGSDGPATIGSGRVAVRVVAADEERVMAREAWTAAHGSAAGLDPPRDGGPS